MIEAGRCQWGGGGRAGDRGGRGSDMIRQRWGREIRTGRRFADGWGVAVAWRFGGGSWGYKPRFGPRLESLLWYVGFYCFIVLLNCLIVLFILYSFISALPADGDGRRVAAHIYSKLSYGVRHFLCMVQYTASNFGSSDH